METLHPMAVHLPIALALIWPLVDLAGFWLQRSDVSWTAIALLVVAIPCALFATVTGQAAYDAAIAAGQPAERLDLHADIASLLPWLLLIAGALRALLPRKAGRRGQLFAIGIGILIGALVVNAGYTGGQLVYRWGVGVKVEGPR
jgi:uncharacterized membrane protein